MLSNSFQTIETADLATLVALDAAEEGNTLASKLLIGMPCTVSISTDQYPYTVLSVTASLKTIVVVDDKGEEMTFRMTAKGYRCRKHFKLTLGTADSYHSPEN